ncbi:WD40-repeat-containing domain protein [Lenzites betulinus]|nr:WD40-repeat-containing domain protein [Lenzites betulinus]
MVEEIECEDNPEVIKYRPDGSTLAIQCDNGSVYLYANRATRKLEIVRASRGHVTAEMAWGLHASSDMLFASTACLNDASGVHKAFDVTRNKVVVEFDANKEACSTLALDPSGDRLFIATEGPETTYILRQFDVRARTRKAVHRIELEPFVDLTDKAAIDINSLSLSADGLYLAAGRTDNWVDVYDARMLARGPLHSLAHEDSDKPRRSYGVVKTQWVDGAPYGVGLVSGGADGCVRLWDVRRSSDDPHNGTVLARCDNDVSTFTLGHMYRREAPLIVGESSGMVTVFEHIGSSY